MGHYRLGAQLVLGTVLVSSVGLRQWFATNLAFVELAQCLVPIAWTSDLTGRHQPEVGHKLPSELCLEPVRQAKVASRSLRARLQLIDAEIAIDDGRWLDAVAHYEGAKELLGHPVPAISFDMVNTLMSKQKDYPAALAAALDGLRESPEDQDLRATAAILYLYYVPPYGRYRDALSVMRPDLGFSYPYYYNVAARAYLGAGEFHKGISMAREAERQARTTRDPNLAISLYLMGVMQRCIGLRDEGRRSLVEALAMSPNDKQIADALASDVPEPCKTISENP